MIESFSKGRKGKIAQDIWDTGHSNKLPIQFHVRAKALLQIMYATDNLDDLKSKGHPPDVRLHSLKHDRKGELAVDIDKISGWRITFRFRKRSFCSVGIEAYH